MVLLPRLKKREVAVKLPAGVDVEKFLERVAEAVKSYGASIKVRGDKVLVEIYGEEFMIRDSLIRLKNLMEEYRPTRSGRGYSLRLISREVGLAVPGDVLALVLRMEGSDARYADGFIETNASYEHVIDAAARVKRALEEARLLESTRSAKKAVVAVASLTGAPVERVVKAGLEAGLLFEDDDGKIVIKKPWMEVVPELKEAAWRL
ncbi:DUF2067 family protein [Stetteria hydrogenophila]